MPPALRLFALLALAPIALGAQEKRADTLLTVEKYLDFEQVGEPRVSPDGSQITYARRWVNKLEDKFESSLWIMSIDGSKNRFLTNGGGASWSPDGTRIAFAGATDGRWNVWSVRRDGTDLRQLTDYGDEHHYVRNPEWSPTGDRLVYEFATFSGNIWAVPLP